MGGNECAVGGKVAPKADLMAKGKSMEGGRTTIRAPSELNPTIWARGPNSLIGRIKSLKPINLVTLDHKRSKSLVKLIDLSIPNINWEED